MYARLTFLAIPVCIAPAMAQPVLCGITANGLKLRLNTSTAAATYIGPTGFSCEAASSDNAGRILMAGPQFPDAILRHDPSTGNQVSLPIVGRPPGYEIRGMAFLSPNLLYVVLSQANPAAIDILARINLDTLVYTTLQPTNRTDIEALAVSPQGHLYGLGSDNGGSLYFFITSTGEAAVFGGGSFGADTQSLEFLPDGTAYACGTNLRLVNTSTGDTTLIGTHGWGSIRGMALLPVPPPCYANCDGSTQSPILTPNDMQCFMNRVASGHPYGNCDGTTGMPWITGNDFQCFLDQYAAGCT